MHQPFKPAAERFAEKVKEKMQRTSAAPTAHPFAGARADNDSLLPFCMFFFTLSLLSAAWGWREAICLRCVSRVRLQPEALKAARTKRLEKTV